MNTMKCKQCGIEMESIVEWIHTRCDYCGEFVCPSCHQKLTVVYSGTPAITGGTSGFLRVCDDCAKKHKHEFKEIKEHPYLG